MSELEFSLIVVSIICGMVITKVLGSVGDMIQGRRARPMYWVHVGWMLLLALSAIAGLRSEFLYESLGVFGYWRYVLALVPYGGLVILSHILCPDLDDIAGSSLESWYYAHMPDFFRAFAIFIAVNGILVNALRDIAWTDPIRLVEVPAIAAALLLSRSTNRRVHALAITLFYVGMLASMERYQ